MLEVMLVVTALASAALATALAAVPPASLMAIGGVALLLLGLLVGLPTGLWYHIVLYRLVSARSALPSTWWLAPSSFHRQLTAAEQRRLAPWYRAGGVGFVLCLAGGLAAIASLLVNW